MSCMPENERLLTRREALQGAAAGMAGMLGISPTLGSESASVPGPHTCVRSHHGKPAFFCDGKPLTKPAFETYVPRTRFFRQFAEAGTDVFSFSTNLGTGFSRPVWTGPDQWDFSALDATARQVLAQHSQALLIPRIYLRTPDWWIDRHPDQCQVLSNGSRTYNRGVGHGRGSKAFPSLLSHQWRQDMSAALQHVIRHMQGCDYGAHLFGYAITGLMSEEWYHWSIHTNQLSDYSIHATRAFRDWLKNKYQTVEALRAAWSDDAIDYKHVAVPSQETRQYGRKRTFRDPTREMAVIDWYLFYNEIVPDTIDWFCQSAKQACHGRKVVGTFYCYMFEFEGDPEYGHNALGKLLQSQHIDFTMVTASYYNRSLGPGADYARAPITSLALHNKLWYHDNDTVSFRYDAMNRHHPDQATVARYRRELGVTANAEETIWQYRRGAGFVLGNGIFQAFFDLHGGYFDDPALMVEVCRLNTLLDKAKHHDCSSAAEILVVSDEPSCAYAPFENPFLLYTLRQTQVSLAKIGAPHDSILVDDLGLVNASQYKLVIFLNCFHLTDAQRDLIHRKVLHSGRTVLWCYASGYFNGAEASALAMQDLVGMRVIRHSQPDPVCAKIALQAGSHPMVDEVIQSGLKTIGWPHCWTQELSVDDTSTVTLGLREGSRNVALALKDGPTWTSVYALNPVLPAICLRALARQAGVHLYNNQDDTLYASRNYLTLSADGAGQRIIRLPCVSDVIDPFTETYTAKGVIEFRHTFKDKETCIWRLSRARS